MKNLLLLLFCGLLAVKGYAHPVTVSVVIHADVPVKSVTIFNFGQVISLTHPYADSLRFTFQAPYADQYQLVLLAGGKKYQQGLWIDPGTCRVQATLEKAAFRLDKVTGSHTQQLDEEVTQLIRQRDTSLKVKSAFLLAKMLENNNNPYALVLARNYTTWNPNNKGGLAKLDSVLRQLDPGLRSSPLYQPVVGRLAALLQVASLTLSDYKAFDTLHIATRLPVPTTEFVLLDFWYTGCGACVAQHEKIKEQYADLRAKGVELIGVSKDKDVGKWQTYLRQKQLPWPNYWIDWREKKSLLTKLGILSFPTYVLLDQKGSLLGQFSAISSVQVFLRKSKETSSVAH